MIHIAVIDDTQEDLEYIASLLESSFSDISPVFYNDPEKAIHELNWSKIDLLILDINMPNINGFDLLERIKKYSFEVIFSTAEEQYALKSYSYFALGYLLKPYTEYDFIAFISKALYRIKHRQNTVVNSQVSKVIPIATTECVFMISIDEIVRVESVNNYAKFHLTDGNAHLSSHGLTYYKNAFDSPTFFRVHKSHVVNTSFVEKYYLDGTLVLKNTDRVPVSRRRREAFLSHFKATK